MTKTRLIRQDLKKKARKQRVRKNLRGTAAKPRLSVVKTNQHLQAQLIDDEQGKTLVGITTGSKELRGTEFNKKNRVSGEKLGALIAEKAKKEGIERVVFDRGPHKYHGVLAALADAARAGGLKL